MNTIKELPTRMKLIKIDIATWNSLKSLKSENDTFNDVIKSLLGQRTKMLGNENISATKYTRKISFVETTHNNVVIGIEFEYNDVKSQKDTFTLDLKFKKIFYENNKIINPSEFFGVDYTHKHFNQNYLQLYLECVAFAISKEFRMNTNEFITTHIENLNIKTEKKYNNLIKWRKLYLENNLSQDSFNEDIEEPLRLSTEEKISIDYKNSIKNSISSKLFKEDSMEHDLGIE